MIQQYPKRERGHYLKAAVRTLAVYVLVSFFCTVSPLHAAYVKRYSTVANGAMTYTGNTLGLNKAASANSPGTSGSIGAFTTTDITSKDGTYPAGTTPLWAKNSSSAVLSIPPGSTVLYAELIWGGSYNYGGENVTASLGTAVTFNTPTGSYSVSPTPSTANTLAGNNYYVRSADVTTMVQTAGAGTYVVGGVPATQSNTENNANSAGWTLAVIYGNPALPVRNMTVFVGGELTSSAIQTLSSVSGFCAPVKGTISARLMVSAMEGDSGITGDQMLFGPTATTLTAVSGPNNLLTNFFSSQINGDTGTRNNSGTFGGANSTPGTNTSGARQGWDITNVDVSTRMRNGQTMAYAKGSTSGDVYVISTIGLQIDVGSPVFPTSAMSVDKSQTFVGDTLTFTVRLDNSAGTADALNVLYTNTPADGLNFVPGSLTMNGVSQAAGNPLGGFSVGTVAAGSTTTLTFQMKVVALPLPPAAAQFQNSSNWSYQYSSCSGFPLNNSVTITAPYVAVTVPRLQPTNSVSPTGKVLPGAIVTYTVTIPNTGTGTSSGTTLTNQVPAGTVYLPGSTTMNGSAVPDVGGAMPFAAGRQVNSPGAPSGQITAGAASVITFQVTIGSNPPPSIISTATIDPDGPGASPGIVVSTTNQPSAADLSITLTNNQTSTVAGSTVSYRATLTNNGPDAIISANLAVSLPAMIHNPLFSTSSGSYNRTNINWSGLDLAAGQSATLTITGVVAADASGPLSVSVTVAAAPGVLDSNPANNTATDVDTVTYVADLGIAISNGNAVIAPGAQVTYTITVTNNGPSFVQSFTVDDTLPALLQSPVFTPAQGTYNEQTGLWTGLNLLPGQSIVLTLKGAVDPNVTSSFVNSVTVTPPQGVTDPVTANNTATDAKLTTPQITLNKSVEPATALPGQEILYTVYYRNIGGSQAVNLVISDSLPHLTTYIHGSMKSGDAASSYANATPVTEAADGDVGQMSGSGVIFTIPAVAGDDGVPEAGNDEGKVYYKVRIN
jgi:uncharacterized repeat protein (TIGR01451 family)